MHILVPTGIFHPESGGPATYLYHFLPELLARGHTVEVVTFGEGPTDYPYPVTRIPRTNILHRNWAYAQAVKQRLGKADGVFINSLGLQLPQLNRPSILKIVGDRAWERCINRGWVPITTDIDDFQTRRDNPFIQWVKHARTEEARRADQIIVPSEYLKRMVMGWGVQESRVRVIYNAFEALPATPASRADFGLPEGVPLLLTVARLTAWKGVDALLEALVSLPEIHLVVAGDGPAAGDFRTLSEKLGLSGRVYFLGNLPAGQVRQLYPLADYLVLYSGYEGLSHVVLESLHAGTPVIASDKGGNPEIVRHNKNGLLVPYKSAEALQDALQTAFQGDTPRRLRQNAHFEPERFAWGRMVDETIALLEAQFAQ